MKRRRWAPALLAAAATLIACNAIIGIDGDVVDFAGDAAADSATIPPVEGGDANASPDVGVTGDAAALAFTITPPTAKLAQGGKLTVKVAVGGAPELLFTKLTFSNLPAGVTVSPAEMTVQGNASATFELTASRFASQKPKVASVVATGLGMRSTDLPIDVAGVIDGDFGDGGIADLDFKLVISGPIDGRDQIGLVTTSDDKLIVAASDAITLVRTRAVVAAFTPQGGLDPAFGTGGKLLVMDDARAYDLAPTSGGWFVVGSVAALPAGQHDLFAARITTNAVVDTATYNAGGAPSEAFFSVVATSAAEAMALGFAQSARSLILPLANPITLPAAGTFDPTPQNLPAARALLKDTSDGVLIVGDGPTTLLFGRVVRKLVADSSADTTFGTSGSYDTRLNNYGNELRAGAVADGGFVFAGSVATIQGDASAPLDRFRLSRATETGVPDVAFGDAGHVGVTPAGAFIRATSAAVYVEADGRTTIGGSVTAVDNKKLLVLARFDATGRLDKTFEAGGFLVIDAGAGVDAEVKRLVRHKDGIVAAVSTSKPAFATGTTKLQNVFLMRLAPDP